MRKFIWAIKNWTDIVFKSNYYFMSGDNSMNSVDSRFWGLIPEDFIVGKGNLVITAYVIRERYVGTEY